jgi:hypothetical protein
MIITPLFAEAIHSIGIIDHSYRAATHDFFNIRDQKTGLIDPPNIDSSLTFHTSRRNIKCIAVCIVVCKVAIRQSHGFSKILEIERRLFAPPIFLLYTIK